LQSKKPNHMKKFPKPEEEKEGIVLKTGEGSKEGEGLWLHKPHSCQSWRSKIQKSGLQSQGEEIANDLHECLNFKGERKETGLCFKRKVEVRKTAGNRSPARQKTKARGKGGGLLSICAIIKKRHSGGKKKRKKRQ